MIKAFLTFAVFAGAVHAEAYRFGHVWDGERLLTNAVIVVEKDRIKSVCASDSTAIDMSRYTAVPGLIDVHTHLTYVLDTHRASRPRRGGGLSVAGQRKEDTRNRRDYGSQPWCERLRRYRDARFDQCRDDGRSAHVRLGLRTLHHAWR